MAMPLYKRPGFIVFLDDDVEYLLNLSEILPSDWIFKMLTNTNELIERIHSEYPQLSDEIWHHQSMIEKSLNGESAIASMLDYWRLDGDKRYTTTRLLVVDYSMPSQSGVEVLEQLVGWPGTRLMLTGQADELLAVTAFNKGLIQQFFPKQSKNLATRLVDTINEQLDHPLDDFGKIWLNNLSREQVALLNDPVSSIWLRELLAAENIIEYVVIGVPFGVLGLKPNGQAIWFQLEQGGLTRSLTEMADALEDSKLTAEELIDIRAGRVIVDFELQLALKSNTALRCEPAVLSPSASGLSAAKFPIPPERCPGEDSGLNGLIARIK